ncbi:restriction endonuclease subunit S [Helicobacter ibis]|uniref:Restriction endonuclease subunit S n=1 Tax=Helicobacter ibis TaxID=2962633 RepID=A0ABT4VBQ2_9HELI|nr:restriction endonuclease subunit S [Helicobacter ibis]MDA3968124.1 restriction endonuclease subunit S [Helicobacter ibis]
MDNLPSLEQNSLKTYSLNDTQNFSLSIGKRVLDSELDINGAIPVFSVNVKKAFGFINKEILQDYSNDCVLWGIDGDFMVGFMPKGKKFYPTDHCGILSVNEAVLNTKIVSFALEQEGEKREFSRTLRASIDRIRDLKITLPPLEIQNTIAKEVQILEDKIQSFKSLLPLLEKSKSKILGQPLKSS